MPVVVTRPPGVARLNISVSRSYSPHSTPALARAVPRSGSTCTPLRLERSTSTPPSTLLSPATLCPPQRTASGSRCWRAKATASRMSAAPVGRTISAGRRSIMPL